MDTIQINEILRRCTETKQFYMGCYPCDQIPMIDKYPTSLVLNLEPINSIGSHWVALVFDNPFHVYYFDSMGEAPNSCIDNRLNEIEKKHCITFNKKPIQPLSSHFCGLYCLCFIHFMSVNINNFDAFDCFLKLFSKNVVNNDKIVYKYVKHMFS